MPARIETGAMQIGAMLRVGGTYRVPPYQRDYSWSEDEFGRFWDDLITTIDRRREDYFIGSMVINDSDQTALEVIDGQQRLTTVSLMICALRDLVREAGNEIIAQGLTGDFLGRIDYQTQETVPRLELNKTNKRFYIENILTNPQLQRLEGFQRQRDLKKSNKLIAAAYLFFRNKIQQRMASGKAITQIVPEIANALDGSLSIIQIKVKSDYDAYLLFETLNDRGLALSVSDLLKNHLYSRAGDRQSEVQENWEEMSANLGVNEIKTFLRHYWLSVEGVVRDKELYKEITEKFNAQNQVIKFSAQLRDSASLYGAFNDVDNAWWGTFEPDTRRRIRRWIEQINLFGVTQYNPLLLAAIETNPHIFEPVLHMAVVFAFRYSVIGGYGPGNIEAAISDAARFIRANKDCALNQVFERIARLYPDDEKFLSSFQTKEIKQSGLARYILAHINDHLMGKDGLVTDRDPSELNLEHILPKKPSPEWLASLNVSEEIAAEMVHRLGNMTLLPSRINRTLANSSFENKKARGYSASVLKITEPVIALDRWSMQQIEERQAWLASKALEIWKVRL